MITILAEKFLSAVSYLPFPKAPLLHSLFPAKRKRCPIAQVKGEMAMD